MRLCLFACVCAGEHVAPFGVSTRTEAPLSDETWPNLCEFAHFFKPLM